MANLQINVPPDVVRQPGLVSTSGALSTSIAQTGATLIALNSSTSGALAAQISSSAAGVGQLNGLSGTLNLVGTGGLMITANGQNIILSGAASGAGGGAGDVTQAQLNALSGFTTGLVGIPTGTAATTNAYRLLTGASGWLLNQPQVPMLGGSGLYVNSVAYESFSANRNLTFSGTPIESSFITLFANVTNTTVLGIPLSYRLGQFGATTGIVFPPGNHEISWTYSDGKWWMADTAGSLNNFGSAAAPAITNDWTSGYGVGSQWINTGTNIAYICTDATSGAAKWYQFSPPTGGTTGGATGGVTQGQLDAVSGWAYYSITGVSGSLSALRVTGSNVIPSVNLTGLGGTLVIRSGEYVFVSGAAGGGGSITSITGGVTGVVEGNTIRAAVSYIGNLLYQTNAGAVTLVDMPITTGLADNTEVSYSFKLDNQTIFKVYAQVDPTGSVDNGRIEVNNAPLLYYTGAYAIGTPYVLTNTSAAVTLGTTSPSITIPYAGTWEVSAGVNLGYSGATTISESVALKIRRTNNTATDLTGTNTVLQPPPVTGATYTYNIFPLPSMTYTTAFANDVLSIFGNVSATLAAGGITVRPSGTWITAKRLF